MPVRIVVTLLRALVTVSVTVVVLTGENSRATARVQVALLFSVGDPETHVAVSGLAVLVVGVGLVHAVQQISVLVGGGRASGIVGDCVGGSTVTDACLDWVVLVAAHVLDHQVAVQVGVGATT